MRRPSPLSSLVLIVAIGWMATLAGCQKGADQPAGKPPGEAPVAAASPHGASPHGTSPHGTSPHGTSPHATSPHGDSPHAASTQGGMADLEGPTDADALPLKRTGLSSAAEMARDRARLDTPALQESYERAFRLAFATKMALRDYPESARLIATVVAERPEYAPAYRVLGYAKFNMDRGTDALAAYQRAIALDPNYGEAHYALAFLLAMGDRAVGREHFRKAMDLGIPDERNLGGQFYPPSP